jgi:hypothetical protein
MQRRVREHAEELGFSPADSLSSIYTALAAEGLRARLRQIEEAKMATAYDAWANDPDRLAANRAAAEMAFEDGLV